MNKQVHFLTVRQTKWREVLLRIFLKKNTFKQFLNRNITLTLLGEHMYSLFQSNPKWSKFCFYLSKRTLQDNHISKHMPLQFTTLIILEKKKTFKYMPILSLQQRSEGPLSHGDSWHTFPNLLLCLTVLDLKLYRKPYLLKFEISRRINNRTKDSLTKCQPVTEIVT